MTTATPDILATHRIVELLARQPSLTELDLFSTLWRAQRVHLEALPPHSHRLLESPHQNTAIVDINDGYAIAFTIGSPADLLSLAARPLHNTGDFALGILKRDEIFHSRTAPTGSPVIYVPAHTEACLEAIRSGAVASTSSIGPAGLAGTSIEIDIGGVPLREGLLLIAEKGHEDDIFRIFRGKGLDAVTIGEVTADGILRVKNHGEIVAEIPNRALAAEAPAYTPPPHTAPLDPPESKLTVTREPLESLLTLLADIRSKQSSDADIIPIEETGTSVAVSVEAAPHEGTELTVAECCRNLSTVGAIPIAAIHNPSVAAAVGLVITSRPATIPFKAPGRHVILLGGFGRPDRSHMGGTRYASAVIQELWGIAPALDMEYERNVQSAIRDIVKAGLAESAHNLTAGGLAVALAESTCGGIGAHIELDYAIHPDLLLFHEGPSRILISTMHASQVKRIALFFGVEAPLVGRTVDSNLTLTNRNETLLDTPIAALNARRTDAR